MVNPRIEFPPLHVRNMAAPRAQTKKACINNQVVFLSGEDDFAVERRAKEVLDQWKSRYPDAEYEEIDGRVGSSSEASSQLGRFLASLQTPPFFGAEKIIYFKKCSFLGDDRTSSSREISEFVSGMPAELAKLADLPVFVIWTAGKVDKRKSFFKSIGQVAVSESFDGWNTRSRNWQESARQFVAAEFTRQGKSVSARTMDFLIEYSGANPRQMAQEIEKICLYAGPDQDKIDRGTIEKVAIRVQEAGAFELTEAMGSKDVKRVLHLLDVEFAMMASDRSKSVIAIVYTLISKLRALIFARVLLDEKLLVMGMSYSSFQKAIEELPESVAPADAKYSPKSVPVYGLYMAYQQCGHFSLSGLVEGLGMLLECNKQLVTSAADPRYLLQSTLIRIVNPT
jgi:DNA polymerase III subunit delta